MKSYCISCLYFQLQSEMAEGGHDHEYIAGSLDTAELKEKFLHCALCLEMFTEPKVLPCQHTFCLDCLQKYVKTRTGKKSVPCPLCNTFAKIPQNKVECLPNNFDIKNLIEHVKSSKSDKTDYKSHEIPASTKKTVLELPVPEKDICGTCDGICLESVCMECHMWFCGTCTRAHRRIPATSNHTLMSFEEVAKKCADVAINWKDSLIRLQEEMKTRIKYLKYAAGQQDKDCSQLKRDIKASARDFHKAIEENCQMMLLEVDTFYTENTNTTKTWISEIEKNVEAINEGLIAVNFVKDYPSMKGQQILQDVSSVLAKYCIKEEESGTGTRPPLTDTLNHQVLKLQGEPFEGNIHTLTFKACDARLAELINSGIGFVFSHEMGSAGYDAEVCCLACNGSGFTNPLGFLTLKIKCKMCKGSGLATDCYYDGDSFLKDLGNTIMRTMAFGIEDSEF